jgi:hypothetical protein
LYYAQQRASAAVLQELRQRLEAGLELPFHAYELLGQLEVTDEGPIAAEILDVSRDTRDLNAIAVMAGPKTVGILVDKYMACARALKVARNDRGLSDEYHRLRSRIGATRASFVLAAVVARGDADDPDLISSLASLVFLHGDHDDQKLPIPVDPAVKPQLIGILRSWVEAVILSPSGERYHLNDVSNAIGRVGFRELLPEIKRLLDEDLARLKKAIDGFLEARKRGDIRATSDASMRYGSVPGSILAPRRRITQSGGRNRPHRRAPRHPLSARCLLVGPGGRLQVEPPGGGDPGDEVAVNADLTKPTGPAPTGFAADSPLGGDGFEPSVPVRGTFFQIRSSNGSA